MNPIREFQEQVARNIDSLGADKALAALSTDWLKRTLPYNYSYNFRCLGRPIIQYPQDIVAIQELIWSVQPDLIVETGIAHGGSLILSASMMSLLDLCDAAKEKQLLDPQNSRRRVLGVDIDIRAHNRAALEAHPLAHGIEMIQGSSIDASVIQKVSEFAKRYERIMVILDSNHTHEHVLAELEAYAPLTSTGSYCIVFDTVVEDLPDGMFPDRPWGKGNNPKTAVREYLRRLGDEGRNAADGKRLFLEIDKAVEHKLLITVAPEGYLRRVS